MRVLPVFLTILLLASICQADALERVLKSEAINELEQETDYITAKKLEYSSYFKLQGIDPDSNYGGLFVKKSHKIIDWLVPNLSKIEFQQPYSRLDADTVIVSTVLKRDFINKLKLNVLIPKPKIHEMVRLKLVEPINNLTPKEYQLKSKRKLNIQGAEALLYEELKGRCSLQVKLVKEVVVELYAENCLSSEELENVANEFRIKRTIKKLNS